MAISSAVNESAERITTGVAAGVNVVQHEEMTSGRTWGEEVMEVGLVVIDVVVVVWWWAQALNGAGTNLTKHPHPTKISKSSTDYS